MVGVWFQWYPTNLIIALRDSSDGTNMMDREKFLNSIEVLDLSEFSLAVVPDFVKEMGNLRILNLSRNKISGSVDGSMFPNKLEKLDLTGNTIEVFSFENSTPQLLSSLDELRLGYNQIKKLPAKLNLAVELTTLGLEYNEITSLDKDIKLPLSLYDLNLEGNNIRTIEVARGGLTRCKEINLSNNDLKELNLGLLKGKVRYIDVTGNDIENWDFLSVASSKNITIRM